MSVSGSHGPPGPGRGVAVPHLPAGLTDADVTRLREQWGRNVLPAARVRSWWRHLVDQLVHFFALLLWAAAGLALLAGLPQLAVAIAVSAAGVLLIADAVWKAARRSTPLGAIPDPAGR